MAVRALTSPPPPALASQYRVLFELPATCAGPTDGADNNNMNNFPLRGCKGGYFEGGVRGVGLLHGYGLWKTGIVSEQLHHVNDCALADSRPACL